MTACAMLLCGLCLVMQGCALERLRNIAVPAEGGGKPQSALKVALLEPRHLNKQIREKTRELAGHGDLKLAGSEADYYIDVQEAQLRQKLKDSDIGLFRERDSIVLRISGSTAFNTNSSRLKPEAQSTLATISGVLSEYRKTFVIVNSYTDKLGDADHNRRLSEQRAIAVAHFMVGHGVQAIRVAAVGHGESEPLDQAGISGSRWPDRRIELRLEPIIGALLQ